MNDVKTFVFLVAEQDKKEKEKSKKPKEKEKLDSIWKEKEEPNTLDKNDRCVGKI